MVDYLLRTVAASIVAMSVYMILKDQREGKYGMAAFWIVPLLGGLRAFFV